MKTIIAGSRTITDYKVVENAIKESGFDITTVVCGCAKGVDTLGAEYANKHNIPIENYPADWGKRGKSAGYIRNIEMAKNADSLIAVMVSGGSRGTSHMIAIAKAMRLKIFVKEI